MLIAFSPLVEDRSQQSWSVGIAAGIILIAVIGGGFIVSTITGNRAKAASTIEMSAINSAIDSLRQELKRIEGKEKADFQQFELRHGMLLEALRGVDAEKKAKEADKTVLLVGNNLLQGFYTDEAAWALAYPQWEAAIKQIDNIMSGDLGDRHAPLFNDRLRDIEHNTPLPPAELTAHDNQVHFRIVFLAQTSYANRRDNIFIYLSNKAQIPWH